MSHPKTDICLVYKSPGRVLPRVDVVNEVLVLVGDGLQQPQPDVLGVSVGDDNVGKFSFELLIIISADSTPVMLLANP